MASDGRDPVTGRFAPGWRGGKGNPLARRVGRLRAELLRAVTPEDIRGVVDALLAERRAEQESVVAANRVLQRIAGELAFAAGDGLGPATLTATGSERIEFRLPIGGGAFGAGRVLALELEEGELDNDRDDDGDGLADEQRITWIEDEGGAGERRTTFATAVAEYSMTTRTA